MRRAAARFVLSNFTAHAQEEDPKMNPWTHTRKMRRAVGVAFLIASCASSAWAVVANSPGEAKCQEALNKSISKQTAAVAKALSSCKNSVLAGDIPGPCPDATAQAAIDKATTKALKVAKNCQSTCSVSAVSCIGSPTCPPNGTLLEACTAAGKNIFESTSMGFSGPYCPSILGHDMEEPDDFGQCAAGLGDIIAAEMLRQSYGDLTGSPALSKDAESCLSTIVKSLPKSASKMAAAVAKCRTAQLTSSEAVILPDNCPTDDAKTASSIDKTTQTFLDGIAQACTDASVAELDLCGQGLGAITTVAAAQDCLGLVLEESSYSVEDPETRTYVDLSIINGSYPSTASARCGDNLVNQLPNQFFLLGEECDGTDDAACPGECLPPGDVFSCTCGNVARARTFADGPTSDLDNGWTGASQNSKVTDGAGFISTLTNCDCDQFDPVDKSTCIGASSDPVCDTYASLKPRCSQRIGDGTTCDEVGNNNGAHTDTDCRACDEYSTNTGDFCTGSARYCIGGANTGDACNLDTDCPAGSCNGSGACLTGPFAGNGCSSNAQCGVCVGGANNGLACGVNANCPGGACSVNACSNATCFGGPNDGIQCGTATQCLGGGTCNIGTLKCDGGSNPGANCLVASQCTGGNCSPNSDCGSQCFTEGGVPTTDCASQADCADGERCRGICETTNYCLKLRNGAPLPLSSEGTSVCIDSQFFTDAIGTKDIVTGAHAVNYHLRSVTILANEINSRPCPVCGGFCDSNAGALAGYRCNGNCSGVERECRFGTNIGNSCTTNTDCGGSLCTNVPCRFDEDCPSGTCGGAASSECQGATCRLDLACGGGPNNGKPCRLEAYTAFGTTSTDCPSGGSNVSGAGLALEWEPLTSGVVTLKEPGACDALGYENYDCNCVRGGGQTRNQPNRCQPACNAPGPNFGQVCANFTTCVGGAENGAACDADADCSGGGLCTGNPRVCGTGNAGTCSIKRCAGGSANGQVCATNGQCPGGTCPGTACTVGGAPCVDGVCNAPTCSTNGDCNMGVTCDDVCPGGDCTPLCVESGICAGGDRNGGRCALDEDCTGGGTCGAGPESEGACAQGFFNHCDGPGWEFTSCQPNFVNSQGGCEMGTDLVLGNSNDFVGAGFCRADVANCFFNNGLAEGGTTLNSKGDPTNGFSVTSYCIPASTSSSVNATAGLPGPGRVRQPTVSVPNFTSLP